MDVETEIPLKMMPREIADEFKIKESKLSESPGLLCLTLVTGQQFNALKAFWADLDRDCAKSRQKVRGYLKKTRTKQLMATKITPFNVTVDGRQISVAPKEGDFKKKNLQDKSTPQFVLATAIPRCREHLKLLLGEENQLNDGLKAEWQRILTSFSPADSSVEVEKTGLVGVEIHRWIKTGASDTLCVRLIASAIKDSLVTGMGRESLTQEAIGTSMTDLYFDYFEDYYQKAMEALTVGLIVGGWYVYRDIGLRGVFFEPTVRTAETGQLKSLLPPLVGSRISSISFSYSEDELQVTDNSIAEMETLLEKAFGFKRGVESEFKVYVSGYFALLRDQQLLSDDCESSSFIEE